MTHATFAMQREFIARLCKCVRLYRAHDVRAHMLRVHARWITFYLLESKKNVLTRLKLMQITTSDNFKVIKLLIITLHSVWTIFNTRDHKKTCDNQLQLTIYFLRYVLVTWGWAFTAFDHLFSQSRYTYIYIYISLLRVFCYHTVHIFVECVTRMLRKDKRSHTHTHVNRTANWLLL